VAADAQQMQEDLERLLVGEAPLPAPRPKQTAAPQSNLHRRAWIGALCALVMALGIGGGLVAAAQPAASTPAAGAGGILCHSRPPRAYGLVEGPGLDGAGLCCSG
jgi:hypothetical protein